MGKYDADKYKEQLLFHAFDSMPGGVLIYKANEEEEILYANHATLTIFECDSFDEFMELSEGSFKKMVHPDDIELVESDIENQIITGIDKFDHVNYRIITKNNKVRYLEDYGKLVEHPELGLLYYVFLVDTDIKYLTYDVDKLTGLPGQKRFDEYATRLLKLMSINKDAPEMVYIYLNISHFKIINIKYGIERGDRILKEVASILKDTFKNDYISRFADDHFALLTVHEGIKEKIESVSRRIMDIELIGNTIELKIGAYLVTDYNEKAEISVGYAQIACESIKYQAGEHFIYYTEELGRKINLQYYVVNNIEKAIEKGYIKVFYQPVIRALTGELCGMEALARWIDPEVGFLNPYDFISALEDARLIHKLDRYIVEEVCKNYKRCVENDIPLVPVSFNLSRLDFVLTDIRKEIDDLAVLYNVPKKMLNIEITESMFMEDASRIKSQIDGFHESGYNVWMDDFGSGYSSLNVLKDFDFDELKIDMVFLSNFNKKSKDILESAVMMAKKINIQTLAEGVENKEQFEFLRSIGCEKIQGYYFSKPSPYEEIIKNCEEKGAVVEELSESEYYDRVGKVNFLTDKPLAISEDDGKHFRIFFANELFSEILRDSGVQSVEEAERNMNNPDNPIHKMLREFAVRVQENEEKEMTYPYGKEYMELEARVIAELNGRYMYALSINNITKNVNMKEKI